MMFMWFAIRELVEEDSDAQATSPLFFTSMHIITLDCNKIINKRERAWKVIYDDGHRITA